VALLRLDDRQYVVLGDVGDQTFAPSGDEGVAQVTLGDLAAALLRQLGGDEFLGNAGERMLDAQRRLAGPLDSIRTKREHWPC
jgi:hypothetical protein